MTSAKNFFSSGDQSAILKAIADAEKNTSGEIRIHIENSFSGDVLDQASFIFKKLKMHETDQRNGVLIYLAIKNRQFAIIGDAGINARVPEGFWDHIKEMMAENFSQNRFMEGLTEAVRMTGEQLKEHFPYLKNDINELPDDISFG